MIKKIVFDIIESIIRNISGGIGVKIRRVYYSSRLKSCGNALTIGVGVHFSGLSYIAIGDNVWIDNNCVIIAGKHRSQNKRVIFQSTEIEEGNLVIGSNTHIGIGSIIQSHGGVLIQEGFTSSAGCKLYSLSNDYRKCKFGTVGDSSKIFYTQSSIVIRNNVWLGVGSLVFGGEVGNDVFSKPYTIISRRIPENTIIEGRTAEITGKRFLYHE